MNFIKEFGILPRHKGCTPLFSDELLDSAPVSFLLDVDVLAVQPNLVNDLAALSLEHGAAGADKPGPSTKETAVPSQFRTHHARYFGGRLNYGQTRSSGRRSDKLDGSRFLGEVICASVIPPGPHFQQDIDVQWCTRWSNARNPNSVTSVDQLNVNAATMQLVKARGVEELTAVQRLVIPNVRLPEKRDAGTALLVRAPTGSGKTLAVLIPIVAAITAHRQPRMQGPFALFLAHNNLACVQLYKELLAFCPKDSAISVGYSCGSADPKVANRQVEGGVDILVCTSGRGDNHLIALPGVRIGAGTERCRLIFLTNSFKCWETVAASLKPLKVTCYSVGVATLPTTVRTSIKEVPEERKLNELLAILRECRERQGACKFLVFCRENDRCAQLSGRLRREGYLASSAASLENMAGVSRDLDQFAQGVLDVVVAQDVCARMLNIRELDGVVQYDLPAAEAFHNFLPRIGRAGRLGNPGRCTVFFEPAHDLPLVRLIRPVSQPQPGF